jgi:hypothetical protein
VHFQLHKTKKIYFLFLHFIVIILLCFIIWSFLINFFFCILLFCTSRYRLFCSFWKLGEIKKKKLTTTDSGYNVILHGVAQLSCLLHRDNEIIHLNYCGFEVGFFLFLSFFLRRCVVVCIQKSLLCSLKVG